MFAMFALAVTQGQVPSHSPDVKIGNFLVGAPCGIAFIYRDLAAFVVDTGGPYTAGTAAPDDSYHRQTFELKGANVTFEWGRVGDAAVAKLFSDRPTDVVLRFSAGWPDLRARFSSTDDGATGQASINGRPVKWNLIASPKSGLTSPDELVLPVEPSQPARFVAGCGPLPALDSVDSTLAKAGAAYTANRPRAEGAWGDFVGAIADNMNNSRIYSTDNHRLAHSVSRRWAGNANSDPYFCWDSFFTANLASIDDPVTARDTVRAILSCQTKAGLVPNFGHWNFGSARSSDDRSQPPVGSLCVWRMHERRPDVEFLREIYPKLLKWHDWWPKFRDGNHDGLLEWGSAGGQWQDAQYETGWDDNLHFAGTRMVASHMNADAVDLTSMWSMDAEYLAKIAQAIGRPADAARLRAEHEATNRRIDALMWNPRLGVYCSRFWNPEHVVRLGPEEFAGGFQGSFYSDETLGSLVTRRFDPKLEFNWGGKAPEPGMSGNHWSARWASTLTPPKNGHYRFDVAADDGVRLTLNGRTVVDDWKVHPPSLHSVDLWLTKGRAMPIVVEYFQREGGSSIHFEVDRIERGRPEDAFLTRVTPMNFYPLLAGVSQGARAAEVMRHLTDPHMFWGRWLIPTLNYRDSNYHEQEYWRGDVWGPVNYLLWEGIRRYATQIQQLDYAQRGVRLFMRNWLSDGICSENYYSTTGKPGGDPHYTWGALLCLVALECVEAQHPQGIALVHVPPQPTAHAPSTYKSKPAANVRR